ncbi:MAG: serine--tRNA ligase [Bacteriovoracaceae bacterium]|nr:serine--tRNA ligase [Bacteriovoracaceae bacterium]
MHDLKLIVNDPDLFKKNLKKRFMDVNIVDEIMNLDKKRREFIQEVEGRRAEVKKLSREIGQLKKNGQDAKKEMTKVASIKKEIEDSGLTLEKIQKQQQEILSVIPNIPADDVPVGEDESSNKIINSWGEPKQFSFTPKDHVELGESLGMLDFEAGAKITGSRFVVNRGLLARLERALINFMIDDHLDNGYEEIIPPYIVNASSMHGSGQLPKFEEDLFRLEGRDWYLIPTAEVPLVNLKRDELFSFKELPIKYCAYTPCFRSEAGSHGKDTRGLIRLHQFNKVELVGIVAAEDSIAAHDAMVRRACAILEKLELPYREVLLSSGDMGFGATRCIDLEVWLPGQDRYREISSISNCTDFQARRASIRYRDNNGKPQFAHTLNGSGLAAGRTLVAIMENYQQEDGTITVPNILLSYMGGVKIISNR